MRGFSLPDCGRGVMVPTSTWEKPMPSSPATEASPLSKPAARPMGLSNWSPRQRVARRACAAGRRQREKPIGTAWSAACAKWWTDSGSNLKRKVRSNGQSMAPVYRGSSSSVMRIASSPSSA